MFQTVLKLRPLSKIAFIAMLLFAVAAGFGRPGTRSAAPGLASFPRLTAWAWENPEDLRALDPTRFAVAYLDQTIFLSPRVWSQPRRQRLLVSPATRIIAVVRIEAQGAGEGIDRPGLAAEVAGLIQHSAGKPRTAMLQIDFDATHSQRSFYAKLLREVRARLPEGMPLSVTALASWCAGDNWIHALPVDEAVPMLFRMGPDHPPTNQPGWSYPVHEPLCGGSAGISTDEPWPALRDDERIYVFHPGAWTPEAMSQIESLVKP